MTIQKVTDPKQSTVLPPMPLAPMMRATARKLVETDYIAFPIKEEKGKCIYLPIYTKSVQARGRITFWPPPACNAWSVEHEISDLVSFWRPF